MRIWACSDLHLSLGGDKPMDVFGEHWREHHHRLAIAWDACVADDDLVLSPGDFSWAGKPAEAEADFAWLAARPGHKVLIKGNHDHWWPKSKTKLHALLPPYTQAIKKTACRVGPVLVFGARGGDFAPLTRYGDERSQEDIDCALDREERELELSIADAERLDATVGPFPHRICCFHYPPMPPGSRSSRFTRLITAARPSHCIYGHLHGTDLGAARVEGLVDGVDYRCTSCDQIDFKPVLLFETDLGEPMTRTTP